MLRVSSLGVIPCPGLGLRVFKGTILAKSACFSARLQLAQAFTATSKESPVIAALKASSGLAFRGVRFRVYWVACIASGASKGTVVFRWGVFNIGWRITCRLRVFLLCALCCCLFSFFRATPRIPVFTANGANLVSASYYLLRMLAATVSRCAYFSAFTEGSTCWRRDSFSL